MGLSPGDRVDRYEVIELLGAGAMGEVYRARDPKLARLVALKILRVDAGPGSDGAARLLREARAAAALSHANVLSVFDIGEVQEPASLRGLAYIAMELVVGRSLRSYIADTSIPIERRVSWLRDVAIALGAAHEAGIVHRDVKPENVMIRADGAVKVLDFGIARRVMTLVERLASTSGQSIPASETAQTEPVLGTFTEQGKVIGTPYYMAPEQLRAEVIDGRADQFAWGVLAHELLTGIGPWQKDADSLVTVSEILSRDARAPREIDSRIPRRVSDAVVRALSKQRGARFPTMGALVASMDGAAAESGERARSRAPEWVPTEEAPARAGRRPSASVARWLLGAAAIVTGISALVVLLRGPQHRSTASVVSTTVVPTGDACTSNAECVRAHGGEAWHCHSEKHVCIEIASTDCKVYAEPSAPEADDVVWFGGMFPLSNSPGAISEMRATDLARQEFAQVLGSSAGRGGTLHARPIGLVVCDEGQNALRAAHHLADDVEVPAVIGFLSSAFTTIPTVFLPRRVLSFVTISQAPAVTEIPEPPGEPRLVWRSTLNTRDFSAPLAHLVSDVLEPASGTSHSR